ncbi:HD domain-containing protein [Sphingorhabdus sp.]|uniref:HD domain-containing protein n=1 Tax=Sphingorhabdus sp. TaxID=1902408 RepID=UPI0032B7E6F2
MSDANLIDRNASFHTMSEGTQEDWDIAMAHLKPHAANGGARVLDHLRLLDGDCGGFAVDRLTHCLQTATRAHRDGRSDDYVVMALLHDIGDTLGAYNHADIAAAILKPFVSEELHWITAHHGIFQGYNFFHYIGLDRNARDRFKDHPHYAAAADFIELYDCPAFDPDYESEPLSFFEPMVMKLFEQPLKSDYKKAFD